MSSATLAGVDAAAAARLAEPGDADLDLDVCDVRLTSVVRVGHELWVRGTGGFGRWAEDGTMVEVSDVTDLSIRAGFPDASEETLEAKYRRLCDWRDAATPLRICGAEGRCSTLVAPDGTWLPLPRGNPS